MKIVKYNGYTVIQADNYDVTIYEEKREVFHSICAVSKTVAELQQAVDDYVRFAYGRKV